MELTTSRPPAIETSDRYRALLESNNAMVSHLEKADLFRATCAALEKVIPYDAAGIAIYELEVDTFRVFAPEGSVSSRSFAVGDLMDRRDCCFGAAFDSQQPVLRHDLRVERVFETDDKLRAEGM